jgi:hypothetical protein
MTTATAPDFSSTLAQLADQAEAVCANPPGLADGLDAVPAHQREAWKRVLVGLAKGEGIEEWVIEPVAKGLAKAGLDEADVLRFFETQGADELRHRDLFLAYIARHFEPAAASEPLWIHQVVYDGLFKAIIQQSEANPLRLLLPLWVYEKTVSGYLTRLMACAGDDLPRLGALMKSIRIDEARHVAGVGLTCKALVAAQKPDIIERGLVMALCQLVVWDMDRAPWWKPELAGHMKALGLDADAMRRDNEAVLTEVAAILEGRA